MESEIFNLLGLRIIQSLDILQICTQPSTLITPIFRACLHGDRGPQVGEVTRLGGVARLSIQSLILMWSRLRVRWGNPPHVTSPTWGPPPSCKQALRNYSLNCNQQLLKLKKKKAFMQILIVAQNYLFKNSFDAFIYLSVIWTGFLPNFVKF